MGVRTAGVDEQAEVFVLWQPLERGRDRLGNGLDGVGDALQVCFEAVLEVVGRVYSGGHQQRVGAREVAVNRLAGHAECAGDVGDGEVRAAGVDGLPSGVEYPSDGLVVAGGGRARPAVGAHGEERYPAASPW